MTTFKDIVAARIGNRPAAVIPTSRGDVLAVANVHGELDIDLQRQCWREDAHIFVLGDGDLQVSYVWRPAPNPISPEAERIAAAYGMPVTMAFFRDDEMAERFQPPPRHDLFQDFG